MNMVEKKEIVREKTTNSIDPILIEKARLLYGSLEKKYPEIMDAEQVAKILQLKPGTIRNWTMRDLIPHRKLNGSARYILSEIVFWLIQQDENGSQKKKKGRPKKINNFAKELLA